MKYSYMGFGMLFFGMLGLVIIVMYESITINNESEYYVLKEAMQAAMYESVDRGYYAGHYHEIKDSNGNVICKKGDVKIVEQKFVENFTRRFAASINGDVNNYTLEFYDIIEKPPKATVVIRGNTDIISSNGGDSGEAIITSDVDIVNNLTGILEMNSSC